MKKRKQWDVPRRMDLIIQQATQYVDPSPLPPSAPHCTRHTPVCLCIPSVYSPYARTLRLPMARHLQQENEGREIHKEGIFTYD